MSISHTLIADPSTGRFDSRNPLGRFIPIPAKIEGLTFVSRTTTSLTFSWVADSVADTYNVYVNSEPTPRRTGILETQVTLTSLSSDSSFNIRVSGVNTVGEGPLSDPVTMTTEAASAGTRDRKIQPFPSDDPFNMPLGVNAYYASPGDPATDDVRLQSGNVQSDAWTVPVFYSTGADPVVEFYDRRSPPKMQSYRADEDWNDTSANSMLMRLNLAAEPAQGSGWPDVWGDWIMIIIDGNEVIDVFKFLWDSNDPSTQKVSGTRVVRNRLDHYSFVTHPYRELITVSNPLANRAGFRVSSNPGIAGLIRLEEIVTENPYIPHAIAVNMHRDDQFGFPQKGDPSSPLYDTGKLFPAATFNYKDTGVGNCRIGMRWAMDPTIVTDDYLSAIPDKHARAVVRALRDYGMIAVDGAQSSSSLYTQVGTPTATRTAMRGWAETGPDGVPMIRHMRRVAGRVGGSTIHAPDESHWQAWADAGQGWGGGAPRVPYVNPLAPL